MRAAFYLKGKIKGDYLLTAAYDSDKDTQERLFRDIQPDEFYPVYGDSSVRGFDAQSTSKLYVRVDKGRSYLLWGDFNTSAASETRKLTNYTRSLTGIKEHYENSRVSVNAFASRDTTRQVIEELRANGTSGPFQLSVPNPLVNSETVEIVTRDRNQPAIIINSVPQTRFTDYEMEPLTGRILFKGPIASVDQNLNPNSVRVTYEVDQGGPEFWVAGVDGQVKVTDRIEVGGIYVKDKNPLQPFTLGGANMVVKLGAGTYVITEVARTISAINGVDDLKGNAGRIELKHESKDLKADIYIAKTDPNFNNPGSYLTQGRSESGGKIDYKLSDKATLHAEALRTEDDVAHAVRDGASVTLQYHIADKLTFEIGMRHSAEKGDVSPVPQTAGTTPPAPLPDEVTTVRARLTGQIPQVKGLSLYGEAEVDVKDTERQDHRGRRRVRAARQEPHLRAPRLHLVDHGSLRPESERAAEHDCHRRRHGIHEGRALLQRVPRARRDRRRRHGSRPRVEEPLVDRPGVEARARPSSACTRSRARAPTRTPPSRSPSSTPRTPTGRAARAWRFATARRRIRCSSPWGSPRR